MRERLIFIPLGGADEVGMNAYVYGFGMPGAEDLILIDLGVTFPDMDEAPGADVATADLNWLWQQGDRLKAVIVTHAHEDHVGGIPYHSDKIRCPVVCTNFTANILERKLLQVQFEPSFEVIRKNRFEEIQIGPFGVKFFQVAHSIPEASGLSINTPVGKILHTGDFKLDTNPVIGPPDDADIWEKAANGEVHTLVCDSTNIMNQHPSRTEGSLSESLVDLMSNCNGIIVATTFASNLARMQVLAQAGIRVGRTVCLAGRAMENMYQVARECGLIPDFPSICSFENAKNVPKERLMLLATGSQGQRRSAGYQLATGSYRGFELGPGDLFVFSSKVIPGNEIGVARMTDGLSRKGVRVVDRPIESIHVSGHANRPDIAEVHDRVNPKIIIPMHGDARMLREHTKFANAKGIASLFVKNGMVVDISSDVPRHVGEVSVSRTFFDQARELGENEIEERKRMLTDGIVSVALAYDQATLQVLGFKMVCSGLPRHAEDSTFKKNLEEKIQFILQSNEIDFEDLVRTLISEKMYDRLGKNPIVALQVSEIS